MSSPSKAGLPARWRRALVATTTIVGSLAFGAATAPPAFVDAVISNGTVALGVHDRAQLNFGGTGVTYVPTGNDGTRAGCPCEGWGVGAVDSAAFSGFVDDNTTGSEGVNLDLVSFGSTASTALSVTSVDNKLRVTHDFHPSPSTPNLYEIEVTVANTSGGVLNDLRYTRLMDWDVEPTPFSEFVTIARGTTPAPAGNLIYSSDDGFENPDPFGPRSPIDPASENADFVDKGPDDHGALFDFGFGSLAAGATKSFFIFYGATATEGSANAAVSAAALELYTYGQPNGGQTTGEPNTFIWGFKAVGGAPVIPPTLNLTPETATNARGTPHTVTAEVRASNGTPVPGATIAFVVTGANPHTATGTTGTNGRATHTWTGTNAGADSIKACIDSNANTACDPDEVSDTATKTWTDAPTSRTIVSSGPLEQITIRNDLGCSVLHSGIGEGPDFQAFNGANGRACGTFLTVGSTLFGPADIPGGTAASPRTTFTPVSQTGVTGAGTAADPFKIVTVVQAGTAGVRVTQTDTYVALPAPGQNIYRTTVQVTNTSGTSRSGILYRAGDCNLLNNDNGFGQQGAPPPPVSCLPSTATPGLVLEWIPTTGGARYYEATATEVWTRIGARQAFPNQCLRCTQNVDNAAGLSWNYSLGANQFNTLASAVNFRHDHDSEVIGSGGGTVSTGSDATPADNTVSTMTFPPQTPPAPSQTITIDERPAPPGFKGQEVEIQPFSGYNDFNNAPTLRITYDSSVNPTLADKTYFVKPTSAFPIAAQPCNNSTQVTPCIVSQTILANGDLVIVLKVLSDDIGFRRR